MERLLCIGYYFGNYEEDKEEERILYLFFKSLYCRRGEKVSLVVGIIEGICKKGCKMMSINGEREVEVTCGRIIRFIFLRF